MCAFVRTGVSLVAHWSNVGWETLLIPEWLDLSAVAVGALAGVFVGEKHKLDLVGFIGMCLICALGGGLLRDGIMQVGSVYALESVWAIPLCVFIAVFGFCFPGLLSRIPSVYEWVDIVSVALFVVAGASKAVAYGLRPSAVVLMGSITGVGGGMLRDVFLGQIPRVFRQSNYYALCAIVGSIVYYACAKTMGMDAIAAPAVTVVSVVLLRRLSLRLGLKSPAGLDLEPALVNTGRRVLQGVQQHHHTHS